MDVAIIVALCTLIVAVIGHIAYVGRWSGRVETLQDAANQRFSALESEIMRLREARHKADGDIQRHEGLLKWVQRQHDHE